MFNSGFRGKRASDGTGVVNPQDKFIQGAYPVPTINSWTISGSDDDALDPAGGQTVLVNGGGFVAGCAVTVNGVTISPVTIVNSNQISFTSPALAGGSYSLIVYNSAGGAAILVPGLIYSSVPTWTTSAGSIGTYYETTAIDEALVATSDSSITYSLTSGSLPIGSTLYANGVITGTSPVDSSSTTYTFGVTATDAEDQDVTRTFTLTINTDVVTWVTPSSGATILLDGTSYSQVLTATDAASYAVSYSANTLPTGLSLSSGTISGTPTVDGTTSTLLTATAATTNRSATNTITWVVSLNDAYWENVSLLLGGSTPTPTFINDASLNNGQLTITGDAKPTSFNPYKEGYYSGSYDATAGVETVTATNLYTIPTSTTPFTVECWVYITSSGGPWTAIATSGTTYSYSLSFGSSLGTYDSTLKPWFGFYSGGWGGVISPTALQRNTWYHVAGVFTGATTKLFVDGVEVVSGGPSTWGANGSGTDNIFVGRRNDATNYFQGHISNARVVIGTAVYTTSFAPLTAPLQAIANTRLLTCQSGRFVDNSPLNATLAVGSSVKLSAANPFATPTTTAYNTQYSTYFDGTSGHLSVPTNTALSMDSGNFSAECWCYLTKYQSSGTPVMVDKSGKGYVSYSHWSINSKNGYWGFDIGISGTPGTQILAVQTSTLTTINQWHHVALVKTGTTYSLFLNGTRIHTATSATVPADNNPLPMAIGFSTDQTNLSYWFGYIADVRVNKGTLPTGYDATQTTITVPSARLTAVTGTTFLSCQNSTLKDNSTNNLTINSISPAKPVAVSPFTMTTSSTTVTSLGSAYFDGTGDYLSLTSSPTFALSGDYTIEAWVYRTDSGTQRAIVDLRGGSYVNVLFYMNSTNKLVAFNSTSSWIVSNNIIPLNQWAHVALTRSGTSVKMFINGLIDATATNSDVNVSSGPPYIGRQNGSTTNDWLGYIEGVRVIKGTALYTSNFLPPQAPLTAVSGTSLLACQYNGGATNNSIIDQSGFNNILTRFGNATQGTFSPFSQTGWSTYYNGTTDYQALATNAVFAIGTADFTVECWVNPSSSAQRWGTIFAGVNYGSSSDWGLYAGDGTTALYPMFFFTSASTPGSGTGSTQGNFSLTSYTALVVGKWSHVAVSRISGIAKMFINGAQVGVSVTATTWSLANTLQKAIGGGYNGNSNTLFPGYISNLRVISGTGLYSSNFTPATSTLSPVTGTILLTNQNNSFIDNSANSFTLTNGGSPSIQAFSPFGSITTTPVSYSTKFSSATSDYLKVPATNTAPTAFDWDSPTWTIEGWYNFNTVSGTTGLFCYPDLMRAYYDGTSFKFEYRHATGPAWAVITATTALTTNTWYHLALVLNNGTMTFYLNGNSAGSATSIGAAARGSVTGFGEVFAIGCDDSFFFGSPDSFLNGYISNFRVASIAVYTGNFTVPTSPLSTTQSSSTNIAALTGTQTTLLTCQSPTMVDITANNITVTASGSPLQKSFNPFGNTNTPNVSYTPAVNGGSIYMDGTGDYLSAATSSSFDLSVGPWTIECWFYQLAAKTVQLFSVGASAWRLAIGSSQGGEFTFNGSSTMLIPNGTFSLNQWNHFAVTFNADGTNTAVRTFANGKWIGSGQFWPSASSSIFYVGRNTDAGAGWDFNGYITDIAITKGRSKYNASFVPSSAPLSVNSNTSFLLNGTSGGIIDYHSSNSLETVGNTQLGSEDPYSGTYYSLALSSSGYLTTPANAAFDLATASASFTLEAWVYFNSYNNMASSAAVIAGNFLTSNGWFWGWYGVNTISHLTLTVYPSGTAANFTMDTTNIPLGKWTHVATVNNAGTLTTYINGVSVGGTVSYAGYTGSGGQLAIGVYQQNLTYAGNPDWSISNLRITKGQALYTSAFTPSTIPLTTTSQSATAANVSILTCQSNTFKDNSTNNFTLTRNTAGSIKSKNPFQQNTGKSLYFDGTGDYIANYTGAVNLVDDKFIMQGNFTIEAWIYPTSTNIVIFCLGNETTNRFIFFLSSSNQLAYDVYLVGTTTFTPTITQGAWSHVALVRSGSTITCYLNGSSIGTGSNSGTLGSGPLSIGVNGSRNGAYWAGYIKDLRITKGVARYTTTFTPPTAPFKTN